MEFLLDTVPSPIGKIFIVSDGEYLRALDFDSEQARLEKLLKKHYGEVTLKPAKNPAGLSDALRSYVDGDVSAIDSLKAKSNGTEFQERVWKELRNIPGGETISYGELARRIGQPSASRAVGLANGSNPIAIVVPCHRVIGANGSLTGYGGGIERKRWLLAHEDAMVGDLVDRMG